MSVRSFHLDRSNQNHLSLCCHFIDRRVLSTTTSRRRLEMTGEEAYKYRPEQANYTYDNATIDGDVGA